MKTMNGKMTGVWGALAAVQLVLSACGAGELSLEGEEVGAGEFQLARDPAKICDESPELVGKVGPVGLVCAKRIEVQGQNLEKPMGWQEAKTACENSNAHKKTGWRLPNIDELNALYDNRYVLRGFTISGRKLAGWYWSSDRGPSSAMMKQFEDGRVASFASSFDEKPLSVRCVRDVGNVTPDETEPKTIEVAGVKLEVQASDLGQLPLEEAKIACAESKAHGRTGWRLPNRVELNALYENRLEIGGFILDVTENVRDGELIYYPSRYWTSDLANSFEWNNEIIEHFWTQRFSDGDQGAAFNKHTNVPFRCVRSP